MAARSGRKRTRPAQTPEDRENQLISLAYDLAERRLIDGTASAQETTHFIKAGSVRGRLEERKIEQENLLLSAKFDQIASSKKVEELIENALIAMREYKGEEPEYYEEEDYYGGR